MFVVRASDTRCGKNLLMGFMKNRLVADDNLNLYCAHQKKSAAICYLVLGFNLKKCALGWSTFSFLTVIFAANDTAAVSLCSERFFNFIFRHVISVKDVLHLFQFC